MTGEIEAGATRDILDQLSEMSNFTIVYVPGFDGDWNKDGVTQYLGYGIGFAYHNYCDITAGNSTKVYLQELDSPSFPSIDVNRNRISRMMS